MIPRDSRISPMRLKSSWARNRPLLRLLLLLAILLSVSCPPRSYPAAVAAAVTVTPTTSPSTTRATETRSPSSSASINTTHSRTARTATPSVSPSGTPSPSRSISRSTSSPTARLGPSPSAPLTPTVALPSTRSATPTRSQAHTNSLPPRPSKTSSVTVPPPPPDLELFFVNDYAVRWAQDMVAANVSQSSGGGGGGAAASQLDANKQAQLLSTAGSCSEGQVKLSSLTSGDLSLYVQLRNNRAEGGVSTAREDDEDTNLEALAASSLYWRKEVVAFFDQSIMGQQHWNPFGFDQRKEVLFRGSSPVDNSTVQAVLNLRNLSRHSNAALLHTPFSSLFGLGSAVSVEESMRLSRAADSVIQVSFRSDECLSPRYDDLIIVTAASDLLLARATTNGGASADDAHPTASLLLTNYFWLREDPLNRTRRIIGLVFSILVALLLMIAALLGNAGVAVIAATDIQLMVTIGRQSCSRSNIASYFEWMWWLVTPTLESNIIPEDANFGVVLIHGIIAVVLFTGFVLLSRMRKKLRMKFPAIPLSVAYILFIGATNSAWLSLLASPSIRSSGATSTFYGGVASQSHSSLYKIGNTALETNPSVATRSLSILFWFLMFMGFVFTVWRIRSPRGLKFLYYTTSKGPLPAFLRGTHSPLLLRGKYGLMIDFWHESHLRFASPVHLAHLSISAILSAFSWNTSLVCFSITGIQLAWQMAVMLVVLATLPGRSRFHNGLLVVHSAVPLGVLGAQLLSLNCDESASHKGRTLMNVAEALVILALSLHLASAVLQLLSAVVEQQFNREAERVANAIAQKHRRDAYAVIGKLRVDGQGASHSPAREWADDAQVLFSHPTSSQDPQPLGDFNFGLAHHHQEVQSSVLEASESAVGYTSRHRSLFSLPEPNGYEGDVWVKQMDHLEMVKRRKKSIAILEAAKAKQQQERQDRGDEPPSLSGTAPMTQQQQQRLMANRTPPTYRLLPRLMDQLLPPAKSNNNNNNNTSHLLRSSPVSHQRRGSPSPSPPASYFPTEAELARMPPPVPVTAVAARRVVVDAEGEEERCGSSSSPHIREGLGRCPTCRMWKLAEDVCVYCNKRGYDML